MLFYEAFCKEVKHYPFMRVACGGGSMYDKSFYIFMVFMNKSCLDYSLGHISRYPKTARDLARFLERKGYEKEIIKETVARLIELGMVDDRKYAQLMLNSEVCRKGKPLYIIKQKLLLKGIDKDLLHEEIIALEEETNEGMSNKIIELIKRMRTSGKEESKIIQSLLGRGYSYDLIKEHINYSN